MMFTVILEDEDGNSIAQADTELLIEATVDLSGFKLLQYLNPYGNTVFNQRQMDDLLIDLSNLSGLVSSPLIAQVVSLAGQCQETTHSYLCFYGD